MKTKNKNELVNKTETITSNPPVRHQYIALQFEGLFLFLCSTKQFTPLLPKKLVLRA